MGTTPTTPKSLVIEMSFDVVDDTTGHHDPEASMGWVNATVGGVTEALVGAIQVVGWPGTDGNGPEGARLIIHVGDVVDNPEFTFADGPVPTDMDEEGCVTTVPAVPERHLQAVQADQ